jgi:hypothetical protein
VSAHPGCEFHLAAEALPLLEGEALEALAATSSLTGSSLRSRS